MRWQASVPCQRILNTAIACLSSTDLKDLFRIPGSTDQIYHSFYSLLSQFVTRTHFFLTSLLQHVITGYRRTTLHVAIFSEQGMDALVYTSRRISMRTPSRTKPVLLLVFCALLITTSTMFFFSHPTTRAAGTGVQVWLTTTDGVNHLTPQNSLQFTPDTNTGTPTIDVNDTQQFQQIDGFGAAITDSSAWLLANKMSVSQRNAVMQNLFDASPSDPTSIGLSFVRIPMGASDFSVTGAYSYDDMPAGQTDPTLAHFSIAHDTSYILPILQQAYQLNPSIRFMANPWSPPGWMKSNGSMIGVYNGQTGTLNASAYGPLAQYFVKFIQAYQAQGIPIYAISPQNEPLYVPPDYPGMSWPASDES